jgi:rod shape-determining protein MreC
LIEDNKALRDQFETKKPISTNLIPAVVIGAPGFIPGITVPENYTLDKGEIDGVKVGDAVIYQENLVGRIIKTTQFLSKVQTITNTASSFTAKTLETNALGVVKGQGGGNLILDNVVLSDNLKVGDIVLSKGEVDVSGNGFVPDLVAGEIIAVSKNPSDLFQSAKVNSHVDFSRIDKVFVVSFQ